MDPMWMAGAETDPKSSGWVECVTTTPQVDNQNQEMCNFTQVTVDNLLESVNTNKEQGS